MKNKKVVMFEGNVYTVEQRGKNVILKRAFIKISEVKKWARDTLALAYSTHDNLKFNHDKKKVFCMIHDLDNTFIGTRWGMAVCRDNKGFNLEIGRAIAFCRMVGRATPEFLNYEWEE